MAKNEQSFEASMQQLEEILDKMSSGGLQLDESVACYAQAATLIKQCNETLARAKVRIEEIDGQMAALENTDGL